MFAIPFNFPFRKSNGDMSTIGAEISAGGGGGGGSYTLPTASAETKGGIKIGNGLTMTGEVLSNNNPTPYTLPTASADTKGGVKVGNGLSINESGVLSASGGGGSTIYYKTFNSATGKSVQVESATGIGALCSFEIENVDIDGYTPIGVEVNDKYSGYKMVAGLRYESGHHSVCIYTGYNGSTAGFIEGTKVYYVPTTSLQSLDSN